MRAWLQGWMILFWLGTAIASAGDPPKDGVTLTYLANEGALLQAGQQSVLIDAFVIEPYSIYAAVDQGTWARMLAGQPPFESIQLALVSHKHRDHFQPEAALAFMKRHPETKLVSSPEVVSELARLDGFSAMADRIHGLLPEPGQVLRWQRDGLLVEVLRIAHAGKRWDRLQNLGHVIHLGGMTILHLGDSNPDASQMQPYRSQFKDLDLALVPYWFYFEKRGRTLVSDLFGARFEVAVHLPLDHSKEIKQLKEWVPHVIPYGEPLQTQTFPRHTD